MTEQTPASGEVRVSRISARIALIGVVALPVLYVLQVMVRALFFSASNTLALIGEALLFLTWIGVFLAAAMALLGGLVWITLWLIRQLA